MTVIQASEDDVIPLSQPIQTASGEMTDCISVSKGTLIRLPIAAVNKSQLLWGESSSHSDGWMVECWRGGRRYLRRRFRVIDTCSRSEDMDQGHVLAGSLQ
jgi:hypothetical protein